MIDVENEVISMITQAVNAEFPSALILGEYITVPASFPCVVVEQIDNAMYERTRTSADSENHAQITFQISVYSNKEEGKKTECKSVFALVDDVFKGIGFTRLMLEPIPNLDHPEIYRMVGRYIGVVSKEKIVFRR